MTSENTNSTLPAVASRNNIAAADYRHVTCGLIFLKQISDALNGGAHANRNIFRMPPNACWSRIQVHARQAGIGEYLEQAMTDIEQENQYLQGIRPKAMQTWI